MTMGFSSLHRHSGWPLLALALAGCAVGPRYSVPPSAAPAHWTGLETASAVVTQESPGDLAQWWQRLQDPVLSSLIDEALRSAPDLRTATARLREARARRAAAGAGLAPSVSASGAARRSTSDTGTGGSGTRNLFDVGFDANWELDVAGGLRRGVEAAQADLEATAADLAAARVTLAAEVARNYVELRALQARLAIARANLASQSETLQLAEWRAQAGLVSEQDVAQARSNREQTRAQIPSLETSLSAAEYALDLLLGHAPGGLHARLQAPAALPAPPARIAVGIPADTLRQRPDVRAAERTLAAETARVGVAQAARYPHLTLTGSIGVEALTARALSDGGSGTSSLLAQLTAPIFDAGRLRANVAAQEAVRERAEVAYEQALLTALQDVENALIALSRGGERAEALARALDAARSAASLARQRYSAGLVDFQSVLDTERTVLSAEDSLAATRGDVVLALIRLYKALGGGWSATPELATQETP